MSKLDKLEGTERARLDKLVSVALSSKNDAEVIASIKAAHGITRKRDMTLLDYYRMNIAGTEGEDRLANITKDLNRITAVEQENERLKLQLSDAQDRLSKAEQASAPRPVETVIASAQNHLAVDGFYTYDAFYSSLISHLGTPKRALSIFTEVSDIPAGRIQSWRRLNKVPESAYKAIATIDRANVVKHNHQPLTGEQKRRIDRLAIEGNTDSQIAETMNMEFGDRTFNVNMIKGAKTQIRAAFLADLKFDGLNREDTKKAFLARYPGARSIDSLLDKVFK